MQNTNNNIFISAGESSGDLLGADLARALLKKNPALKLTGMGGKKMRDAGVKIQFESEKLAVVGLIEIIKHFPAILIMWHNIKKYLRDNKPDLVILIDFPDTHFRIMKTAKKLGIPVLYYVSPQIWAWRAGRIKQIKKQVDHMAVLFSFEEKIYRDANIPVTFVGHPLGNIVKPTLSKNEITTLLTLNPNKPVVTLLPGSRHSELTNHLPIIIESVKKIQAAHPEAQFVLALANHLDKKTIANLLPPSIQLIQNHLYDVLQISDAVIAVSGTVTLEVGLMQTPLCIIYRFSPLTYWVAKKLIRVKQVGLCNIVAEKEIAKEFIQDDVTADNISTEITHLITDKQYNQNMRMALSPIRSRVTHPTKNSSDCVADIALTMLTK
ncbi:MAG: hypothetical protein ACD_42C00044G0002 [uncultured bacterium]|nr:MAG: hypothetical protein ACD_42C00044G0002 [uncultured bacterium]OGT34102.1 MAG: lipid-A-disaccharide synthase [Gammaproteobacteria bacterium RIFCSPHIGHO2_02_FULL_39_13]OGT50426.1 MAG: lipid-A-disaccharide synthase [Gammaproteobacteria bacterium RIFCSPHIGHO2_12_FULL_39_24]